MLAAPAAADVDLGAAQAPDLALAEAGLRSLVVLAQPRVQVVAVPVVRVVLALLPVLVVQVVVEAEVPLRPPSRQSSSAAMARSTP